MNEYRQKETKPNIRKSSTINLSVKSGLQTRNVKTPQNNNIASLSSFKETLQNCNNKDHNQYTPINTSPSNTQASPIVKKDDTITQTETSINTFINLLSPNSHKNILSPKNIVKPKKNTTIITYFNLNNLPLKNGLISNPYISPNIKTKMNNLMVESSSGTQKMTSPYSNIDDIIHSSRTKIKKEEILEMLNTPRRFSRLETKYLISNNNGCSSSRNKVEEIQKILNKCFDQNKLNKINSSANPQNHILNSYRSCKNINQIKKEEENFEVDLFKNQFIHRNLEQKRKKSLNILNNSNKILFFHKKRNSCL